MQTPSHSIVNLALIGRKNSGRLNSVVFLGSFLPDIPILVFAGVGVISRSSFEQMWRVNYFDPRVQAVVSTFHSIPLAILGILIALKYKRKLFCALFISMLLHDLFDFPVHNADAHMHFFPFSKWRFISPVSYWDPRHYGNIFSLIEFALVFIGGYFVWRKIDSRAGKAGIILVNLGYLGMMVAFRLARIY